MGDLVFVLKKEKNTWKKKKVEGKDESRESGKKSKFPNTHLVVKPLLLTVVQRAPENLIALKRITEHRKTEYVVKKFEQERLRY